MASIPQVEPQTAEVMTQMIEMEKLAEEILSSRTMITEYVNRINQNKDTLSALTRGDIKLGINIITYRPKAMDELLSYVY